MSSQYEHHLLPHLPSPSPSLLSRLRRRNPEAERQLIQQYNRSHPTAPAIRVPPPGASYSHYAPVHLGLLWLHVRNREALAVFAGSLWTGCRLAENSGTTASVGAFYHAMPLPLLHRLWTVVHDPDAFRELLRRSDPTAVTDLVGRCHSLLHLSGPTPQPTDGTATEDHPTLLALLWSIGGNTRALDAIARRELGGPLLGTIDTWPKKFLDRLWELARDGDALVELWRREGVDVRGPITTSTPARVLGYRWCFLCDEAAGQEMVRRCNRLPVPAAAFNRADRAEEHRAERAVRVLQQIREWDFRVYPDLTGWLCTVERNAEIDAVRRGRHTPGSNVSPLTDPEDRHGAEALRAVDQQDELDVRASWRRVVVLKLQDGIRLSDAELDRVVHDNLESRGVAEPTDAQVRAERAVVCRALEALKGQKKPAVQTVLRRHKPVRHSQRKRIGKLRMLHDVCAAAIGHLPTSTRPSFEAILAGLDVLFGRSKGEKWTAAAAPAAFVAELQRRSRAALSAAARAGADRTLLDRCRAALHAYLRQFPLLLKTARLHALLSPSSGAVEGKVLAWLDHGRRWLATLHRVDGTICQEFLVQLEAEAGVDAPAEVVLRLLWLESIVRPGRPETWLVDLDEVVQTASNLDVVDLHSLIDALARAARSGNALRVTATANRLRTAIAELPASWEVRRLRSCLARLGGRRAREHALLELCRDLAGRAGAAVPPRLLDWLDRDGCLGETDGPAVEEGRQLRRKLRQAIDPAETPSPRGSVQRMLDLSLGALLGDGLPQLTAEALCTAWAICHADVRWSAEIQQLTDDLADAAWHAAQDGPEEDNWSAVAECADRIRKRVPHCDAIPSGVREELGRVLGRLSRGPRLRTPGGK